MAVEEVEKTKVTVKEDEAKETKNRKESAASKRKSKKPAPKDEPEFRLSQVQMYKPKAYKKTDDFKNMKADKPKDIKFFAKDMKVYQGNKKKPKRTLRYAQLKVVPEDESSPQFVRIVETIKGKEIGHQLVIEDEANRKKARYYLENYRNSEDSQPVPTSPTPSYGRASPGRSEGTSPNETPSTTVNSPAFSMGSASGRASGGNSNVHYMTSNRPKPARFDPGLRNADIESGSDTHGYERQPRGSGVNIEYEGNDFDSNSDQLTQSDKREHRQYPANSGFYETGRQPLNYYSHSRIAPDDGTSYADEEEYVSESSGYDYEYGSEYSNETVVMRPSKPRSLTFYTPFLKVPRNPDHRF